MLRWDGFMVRLVLGLGPAAASAASASQGAGSRKAGGGEGGMWMTLTSPTVLAQDISMTGHNKDGVAVSFGVKI